MIYNFALFCVSSSLDGLNSAVCPGRRCVSVGHGFGSLRSLSKVSTCLAPGMHFIIKSNAHVEVLVDHPGE
jgi:hypothetical protein